MSTNSDAEAQAARAELQAKAAGGRRVEELDDELDVATEALLQERLVELGRRRRMNHQKQATKLPG